MKNFKYLIAIFLITIISCDNEEISPLNTGKLTSKEAFLNSSISPKIKDAIQAKNRTTEQKKLIEELYNNPEGNGFKKREFKNKEGEVVMTVYEKDGMTIINKDLQQPIRHQKINRSSVTLEGSLTICSGELYAWQEVNDHCVPIHCLGISNYNISKAMGAVDYHLDEDNHPYVFVWYGDAEVDNHVLKLLDRTSVEYYSFN